jgi:parallel beta-helix repeat protein
MRRFFGLALIAFVGMATAGTGSSAVAASVVCGQVLTESVSLDGNLVCVGDGLVVGADGITVDLNGHVLRGAGTGDGIRIADSSSVTVRNGTVTGFGDGVRVSGDDNLLESLSVRGNLGSGMRIGSDTAEGVERTRIVGNEIVRNGEGVTFGRPFAPFLPVAFETMLRGNEISLNAGAGIDLGVSNPGNTIVENRVSANGGNGIESLARDSGAMIADNSIVNNGRSGIVLWDTVSYLADNTASGNGEYGIFVLEHICTLAQYYVVTGNTANRNGLLGISFRLSPSCSDEPIGDGSANLAKNNGDPLECVGSGLICNHDSRPAGELPNLDLSRLPTHPT